MEERGATLEELFQVVSGEQAQKMYFQGETDAGLIACGQGIGLAAEIKPAREIMADIIEEASKARERLNAMKSP